MSNNNTKQDYPAQIRMDCDVFKTISDQAIKSGVRSKKLLLVVSELELHCEHHFLHYLNSYFKDLDVKVEVLIVNTNPKALKAFKEYVSESVVQTITFFYLLREESVLRSPIADKLNVSYQIHLWIQKNINADDYSVLFLEKPENSYYTLLARGVGISHSGLKVSLFIQASKYFRLVKSCEPLIDPRQINLFYCQKESIKMSDAVLSNSAHYLGWMNENELIKSSQHTYYCEVPIHENGSYLENLDTKNDEFVFLFDSNSAFEPLYCLEAIRLLQNSSIEVTFFFLPKASRSVKRQIIQKSKEILPVINIKSFKSTDGIETFLKNKHVIIPSKEDIDPVLFSKVLKSKCLVLSNEIYVLEGKSEAELLVFNANPQKIKNYLNGLLSGAIIRHSMQTDDEYRNWRVCIGIKNKDNRPEKLDKGDFLPKVSVCISHFNRGEMLRQAIESVARQTYLPAELIVVDDGSTDTHAINVLDGLASKNYGFPIRVIRQDNFYIGASRNAGLKEAIGEYVLFMDDDNIAMPNELESFVRSVGETNADITTCFSRVFSGRTPEESIMNHQTALFVGPNIAAGLISNPFGDSNMFVNVRALRGVGGFSEHYKIGRDDQEMLARACLNGMRVELIPKPLYYYRLSGSRIRATHISPYSGFSRVMAAYSQSMPFESAIQLRYLQGMAYKIGPWGLSDKSYVIKNRFMEYVRIYIAKYPILYKLGLKILGRE